MAVTLNASTSTGYIQTADTSGDLALQSNGTTQFTVASTGAYGQLKAGTAVASTSGTAIEFTSLPSWVKRITIMFQGVSTSSTSSKQIQIGSGSFTTSGYVQSNAFLGASVGASAAATSGFVIGSVLAADVLSGQVILSLLNPTSNLWVCNGFVGNSSGAAFTYFCSGNLALSGTLDRVRVTTTGADTFDAGSINILYEG